MHLTAASAAAAVSGSDSEPGSDSTLGQRRLALSGSPAARPGALEGADKACPAVTVTVLRRARLRRRARLAINSSAVNRSGRFGGADMRRRRAPSQSQDPPRHGLSLRRSGSPDPDSPGCPRRPGSVRQERSKPSCERLTAFLRLAVGVRALPQERHHRCSKQRGQHNCARRPRERCRMNGITRALPQGFTCQTPRLINKSAEDSLGVLARSAPNPDCDSNYNRWEIAQVYARTNPHVYSRVNPQVTRAAGKSRFTLAHRPGDLHPQPERAQHHLDIPCDLARWRQ